VLFLVTHMREVCRMRVFENRMLRKIFRPKKDEVTGEWEDYITRSLVICSPYQILFWLSNQEE